MITFVLNDRARGKDSFGTFRIVCQTISKELKGLEIFSYPNI